MAQPSAGLALFVCARIVKDTDVLDIIILNQNNHLEPNFQQNRKLSNLYFYVNSRHDSKRKLLFGELETVKECGGVVVDCREGRRDKQSNILR